MKQNLIWPVFLSGLTILVVVFASLLSIDLYKYFQLRCAAPVEHLEASVRELGPNRFQVELDYLYQVNTHKYSRHQELKKITYKNCLLANREIQTLEGKEVSVWYHPEKPHLGVVNKEFPFKRLFSTLVLFSLFVYFCFLGRFMLHRV